MARSRSPGNSSLPPAAEHAAPAAVRAVVAAPHVQLLIEKLGADAALYLVGGTVRDALLGKPPADLDLATRLTPQEVSARLQAGGVRVVETGLRHGTVTAVVEGDNIEITTFRKPGAAQAFAATIDEDLGGRDFTINALAYALPNGPLVDLWNGSDDIRSGTLRAVADPTARFREDPLRILRMVRFGSAAGRTIVADTREAAAGNAALLAQVSVERLRVELEHILMSEHPAAAFRDLLALGILKVVLPETLDSVGFEQNEFHTHDVFEHTLWVIERTPRDLVLRLAALFHDLGKPESLSVDGGRRHFYKHEQISERLCKQAMSRLRFSNDTIEAVLKIVALHMRPIECGPAGVRRLMRELGPEFERWREFKRADLTPIVDELEFNARLNAFDGLVGVERTRQKGSVYGKLAVDGNDMIALGMREGRELGAVLKELEEAVIENPELNERETLLARAKSLIAKR